MRCRRASVAFSSSVTISRCAAISPSLFGARVRTNRNTSANIGGATLKEADCFAIVGHSCHSAKTASFVVTPADSQPFASSFAKLQITASPQMAFDLNESFTLAKNANGINPVTENVTLQIGTFLVTIPAGSFKQNPKGNFAFEGVINGVSLQVQIVPLGNNIFTFKAEGSGVNLTGLRNPVTVVLIIGIDSGTTTATAQF
jgi:hypothetical protein